MKTEVNQMFKKKKNIAKTACQQIVDPFLIVLLLMENCSNL